MENSYLRRIVHYFDDKSFKEHKPEMRWKLMTLCFFLLLFANYSFDLPAPNQNALQHYDMHLTTPQYNMFYACFSLPNIVFIFYIGHFMDIYGDKLVLFLLSLGVLVGSSIFAVAISMRAYYLAVFGRVIFGMCFEPVAMLGKYFPSKWFKNYEISKAYAISMTGSRLGITLVSYLSPLLYNIGGINLPMYVAAFNNIMTLVFAILIGTYDRQYIISEENEENKEELKEELLSLYSNDQLEAEMAEKPIENAFDVFSYGKKFWASMSVMFFTYSAFFCLCANLNELLVIIYEIEVKTAGLIISLAYISFCGVSIICGDTIDKYENKMFLLRVSHITFMIGCACWMILPKSFLILGFLFILIHFCLFQTTFWVIFGRSLKASQSKKGFAMSFAVHDGSFFFFTLLFGLIRDSTIEIRGGFFWSLAFLVFHGFAGLISTYFM